MDPLVYSTINGLVRLAALIGAVPFVAPVLKMFENDFVPLASSILTDFTECTFGGYADITLTWGAPGLDGSNTPVAPAPVLYTGDGTTEGFAYGVYLLTSTGLYVAAARFTDRVKFSNAGDQLAGTLLFGLNSGTMSIAMGP